MPWIPVLSGIQGQGQVRGVGRNRPRVEEKIAFAEVGGTGVSPLLVVRHVVEPEGWESLC